LGEVINDYLNRRWDGVNRFTMIVINKNNSSVQVLSIDPETNQPVRINLPGDMEVNTVSGRGVWKIKSLVALSAKYGYVWAADSIANYLGISYTAVREKVGIWDKIAWWNLSRNVSWQDIDLADLSLVSETYAPDGDRILGLTSRWQDKAEDLFYSSNLAKEKIKVEVYNTTNVTGLATQVAQVIENAGVKVTIVDASDLKTGRCLVMSLPGTENDRGIKWLINNFRCNWKKLSGMDGGEVKIYIGQEYARWLNGEEG
jgi:hypothetical protein